MFIITVIEETTKIYKAYFSNTVSFKTVNAEYEGLGSV
jgi:hypothetical protein